MVALLFSENAYRQAAASDCSEKEYRRLVDDATFQWLGAASD